MKTDSVATLHAQASKKALVSGPVGRLPTLLAAAVLLLLPLLYIGMLVVLGWGLVYFSDWAIEDYAMSRVPVWLSYAKFTGLGVGWLAWAFQFKPLLTRLPRPAASFELKRQGQPEFFELLECLGSAVGARTPVEVRVDGGMEARVTAQGGLFGWLGQRTVLTLGLPLAAGLGGTETAGEIAGAMGRFPKGLHGRLAMFVSGMNRWLQWVANRRDAWQDALAAQAAKGRKKSRKRWWQSLAGGFLWLTRRPIALLTWLGCLASRPALRALVYQTDACAATITGTQAAFAAMQQRPHLHAAWERGEQKLQEGRLTDRLPDNFPMMVARLTSGARATDAALAEAHQGTTTLPGIAARQKRLQKKPLPPLLSLDGNGAGLLRDFQDISRMVSQSHYQRDLGFDITQFRLVSGDETKNHDRRSNEGLLPVRRYFRGLCHSERALCGGHDAAPAAVVSDVAFSAAVEEGRQWLEVNGQQMRAVLDEWHMAWQRLRDLEMAHAFAVAGLPMDSHQYGVAAHRPELYREEIERQRFSLDHSDEALAHYESRLEARFAAALGLLWGSPPESLPEKLRPVREALPDWVALYQSLGDRMRHLRSMMTRFSAFESLGAKFSSGKVDRAYLDAVGFLVPGILSDAQRVLHGLEHCAATPHQAEGAHASLAHYFVSAVPPDGMRLLALNWEGAHGQPLKIEHAAAVCELVEPLLDRFLETFHRASAILAEAAADTEDALIDEPLRARERAGQVRLNTQWLQGDAGVTPAPALA